ARITSGANATNSAAYFRAALMLPAVARISIRTLRPSSQPKCFSSCKNAVTRTLVSDSSAAAPMMIPSRRMRSPCCARTVSGHTATEPAMALMKSEAGSRPRINADEVERVVVEALCRQPSRDRQTTDFLTGVWSAEIRELVRSTVDRIVIHHDDIEMTHKIKELNGTIDGDNHSQNLKTLRLALPPPRARARKEILVPGN